MSSHHRNVGGPTAKTLLQQYDCSPPPHLLDDGRVPPRSQDPMLSLVPHQCAFVTKTLALNIRFACFLQASMME